MNNKPKVLSIVFIILVIAAMIGGVALVGQNQNQQRGAYFAGASLSVLPATITSTVGSNVPVQLWVQTANNAKISAVDTKICYGTGLSLDATDVTTLIDLNQDAFKVIEYANNDTTTHCLKLVAISSGITPENLKSGLVKVANIRFKAATAGTGSVALKTDTSILAGYNPAPGATDTSMNITGITDATYTITGAPTTTTGPYLKFKMSFQGVRPEAACADGDKMPITVTVRAADGTSRAFPGIIPVKESGATGDKAIYDVSLRLGDFTSTSNISVFIKSKKSLQVKYGMNNQTAYYDKAGGELSGLTADEATTPTFDFSKYSLLAGDVTGGSGSQDGSVDALDFSYIKGEAVKRSSVAEHGYLLADLNGNCQMESQDVAGMMLSLSDKLGQLY